MACKYIYNNNTYTEEQFRRLIYDKIENKQIISNDKAIAEFRGGKLYMKEGVEITDEIALYQFSHPFLDSALNSNPQLFGNLFKQSIESHPEIFDELKGKYVKPEHLPLHLKKEYVARVIALEGAKGLTEEGLPKAIEEFEEFLRTTVNSKWKNKVVRNEKLHPSMISINSPLSWVINLLTIADSNISTDETYTVNKFDEFKETFIYDDLPPSIATDMANSIIAYTFNQIEGDITKANFKRLIEEGKQDWIDHLNERFEDERDYLTEEYEDLYDKEGEIERLLKDIDPNTRDIRALSRVDFMKFIKQTPLGSRDGKIVTDALTYKNELLRDDLKKIFNNVNETLDTIFDDSFVKGIQQDFTDDLSEYKIDLFKQLSPRLKNKLLFIPETGSRIDIFEHTDERVFHYLDGKKVYRDLQEVLTSKDDFHVDNDFDTMMDVITKSNITNKQLILKRLETFDEQERLLFATMMHTQEVNMVTIEYSQGLYSMSSIPRFSNHNRLEKLVLTQQMGRAKNNANIIAYEEIKGGVIPVFTKEIIIKTQELLGLMNSDPDNKLKYAHELLEAHDFDIPFQALEHYYSTNKNSFEFLFPKGDKNSGFNKLVKLDGIPQTDYGEIDNAFKSFANIIGPSLNDISPESFLAAGKSLNARLLPRYIVNKIHRIGERARKNSRDVFQKGSNMANTTTRNEKYRLEAHKPRISQVSLEAWREEGRNYNTKGIGDLNEESYVTLMLQHFYNNGKKRQLVPKGKYYVPTLADRTFTPIIEWDRIVKNEDGTFEYTEHLPATTRRDLTLNEILFKLFEKEYQRIKAKGFNKGNIGKYNSNISYFFPNIHESQILWDKNGEIRQDLELEDVQDVLRETFEQIKTDVITDFKMHELFEKGLFPDINGYQSITIEQRDNFIEEFIISTMAFHAEMFQAVIGDPALFTKSGIQPTKIVDIRKALVDDMNNFIKRNGVNGTTYTSVKLPYDSYDILVIEEPKKTAVSFDRLAKMLDDVDNASQVIIENEGAENSKSMQELFPNSWGYTDMDHIDALELVSLEHHLDILVGQGFLLRAEADMIIERDENGKATKEDFATILNNGKPIYNGRTKGENTNREVIIKSSHFPLSKTMIQGNKVLEYYYELMKNSNVKRVVPPSAIKVGQPTILYERSEEFTGAPEQIDAINTSSLTLESSSLGIQYHEPGFKGEIKGGSQKEGFIVGNLNVIGNHFKYNGEVLSGREIRNRYQEKQIEILEKGKDLLVSEIGDTNDINWITLEKILRREMEKLGTPLSDRFLLELKEEMGEVKGFKTKLQFLSQHKRIEPVYNKIISSRIFDNELPGESFILLPSEGYDLQPNTTGQGVVPVGEFRGELQVLNDNNKADVIIPWPFNAPMEDFMVEGVIDITKFDEDLLTSFGFRIPTQGMMSLAGLNIAGFFPPGSGRSIVVPPGFNAQMGSDFDIDKLYTLYKYHFNNNGKMTAVSKDTKDDYIKRLYDETKQGRKAAEDALLSYFDMGYDIFDEDTQELADQLVYEGKYDEFYNVISDKVDKYVLKNELIDIHISIITSDSEVLRNNNAQVLGEGRLRPLAEIYKTHNRPTGAMSFLNIVNYKKAFLNARSAAQGIGTFSLASKFSTALQNHNLPIRIVHGDLTVEIKSKLTGKKISETSKGFIDSPYTLATIEKLKESGRLTDDQIKGPLSNKDLKAAKLTARDIEFKSDIFSYFQNMSLDDANLNIMGPLNIDSVYFDFINYMLYQGFNEEIIVEVINTDVFIEFLTRVKAELGPTSDNTFVPAIMVEVLEKMKNENLTFENNDDYTSYMMGNLVVKTDDVASLIALLDRGINTGSTISNFVSAFNVDGGSGPSSFTQENITTMNTMKNLVSQKVVKNLDQILGEEVTDSDEAASLSVPRKDEKTPKRFKHNSIKSYKLHNLQVLIDYSNQIFPHGELSYNQYRQMIENNVIIDRYNEKTVLSAAYDHYNAYLRASTIPNRGKRLRHLIDPQKVHQDGKLVKTRKTIADRVLQVKALRRNKSAYSFIDNINVYEEEHLSHLRFSKSRFNKNYEKQELSAIARLYDENAEIDEGYTFREFYEDLQDYIVLTNNYSLLNSLPMLNYDLSMVEGNPNPQVIFEDFVKHNPGIFPRVDRKDDRFLKENKKISKKFPSGKLEYFFYETEHNFLTLYAPAYRSKTGHRGDEYNANSRTDNVVLFKRKERGSKMFVRIGTKGLRNSEIGTEGDSVYPDNNFKSTTNTNTVKQAYAWPTTHTTAPIIKKSPKVDLQYHLGQYLTKESMNFLNSILEDRGIVNEYKFVDSFDEEGVVGLYEDGTIYILKGINGHTLSKVIAHETFHSIVDSVLEEVLNGGGGIYREALLSRIEAVRKSMLKSMKDSNDKSLEHALSNAKEFMVAILGNDNNILEKIDEHQAKKGLIGYLEELFDNLLSFLKGKQVSKVVEADVRAFVKSYKHGEQGFKGAVPITILKKLGLGVSSNGAVIKLDIDAKKEVNEEGNVENLFDETFNEKDGGGNIVSTTDKGISVPVTKRSITRDTEEEIDEIGEALMDMDDSEWAPIDKYPKGNKFVLVVSKASMLKIGERGYNVAKDHMQSEISKVYNKINILRGRKNKLYVTVSDTTERLARESKIEDKINEYEKIISYYKDVINNVDNSSTSILAYEEIARENLLKAEDILRQDEISPSEMYFIYNAAEFWIDNLTFKNVRERVDSDTETSLFLKHQVYGGLNEKNFKATFDPIVDSFNRVFREAQLLMINNAQNLVNESFGKEMDAIRKYHTSLTESYITGNKRSKDPLLHATGVMMEQTGEAIESEAATEINKLNKLFKAAIDVLKKRGDKNLWDLFHEYNRDGDGGMTSNIINFIHSDWYFVKSLKRPDRDAKGPERKAYGQWLKDNQTQLDPRILFYDKDLIPTGKTSGNFTKPTKAEIKAHEDYLRGIMGDAFYEYSLKDLKGEIDRFTKERSARKKGLSKELFEIWEIENSPYYAADSVIDGGYFYIDRVLRKTANYKIKSIPKDKKYYNDKMNDIVAEKALYDLWLRMEELNEEFRATLPIEERRKYASNPITYFHKTVLESITKGDAFNYVYDLKEYTGLAKIGRFILNSYHMFADRIIDTGLSNVDIADTDRIGRNNVKLQSSLVRDRVSGEVNARLKLWAFKEDIDIENPSNRIKVSKQRDILTKEAVANFMRKKQSSDLEYSTKLKIHALIAYRNKTEQVEQAEILYNAIESLNRASGSRSTSAAYQEGETKEAKHTIRRALYEYKVFRGKGKDIAHKFDKQLGAKNSEQKQLAKDIQDMKNLLTKEKDKMIKDYPDKADYYEAKYKEQIGELDHIKDMMVTKYNLIDTMIKRLIKYTTALGLMFAPAAFASNFAFGYITNSTTALQGMHVSYKTLNQSYWDTLKSKYVLGGVFSIFTTVGMISAVGMSMGILPFVGLGLAGTIAGNELGKFIGEKIQSDEQFKIAKIMKNYDILQQVINEVYKTAAGTGTDVGNIWERNTYGAIHNSEHANQAVLVQSMLRDNKVTLPDGSVVPILELFDDEGNPIEIKGFDTEDIIADHITNIKAVIQMSHGDYSTHTPLLLKAYGLSKLFIVFKTWYIEGHQNRFESGKTDTRLIHYKTGEKGVKRKGNHTTAAEYLGLGNYAALLGGTYGLINIATLTLTSFSMPAVIAAGVTLLPILGLVGAGMIGNDTIMKPFEKRGDLKNASRAEFVMELLKYYPNVLIKGEHELNITGSEIDDNNIKRLSAEIWLYSLTVLITALVGIIITGIGLDDEDEDHFLRMIAYLTHNKLSNTTGEFTQYHIPVSGNKYRFVDEITAPGAALWKLGNFGSEIGSLITGAEMKGGRGKGYNRFFYRSLNMHPFTKGVFSTDVNTTRNFNKFANDDDD